MDLIVLIGLAIALLVILITTWFFTRKSEKQKQNEPAQVRRVIRPDAAGAAIPRRAQIARNQRHRNRPTEASSITIAAQSVLDSDSDDNDDTTANRPSPFAEEKMGAKKRAKLEAKAEKRAQREAEEQAREERKKREALIEEERRKDDAKVEELEKQREEAERLAREEKARREHEEYLKLKASFQVDEEGYDECNDEEKENLLRSFISYIRENKVVLLEDLATHFKLKTQAAIDRITDLQESGELTGVIDDQGKFIYISDKELEAIGDFIRLRGRVSISELAESSNNLVNLKPNTVPVST